MDDRIDPTEELRIRILLGLLVAGAVVPIWVAPLPPLQDLPNHLLKADVLQHWLWGEKWDAGIYALNLKLLPNYTLYIGLLSLSPIFGLLAAAKIFTSIVLMALPLSAYAFLRRANPQNTILALAVPAMNFSLFLMMGSLNFCLALALYLCALAIFLDERSPAWRPGLGFAVAATALYFTHGFGFLALVGSVACLTVFDYQPGMLRRAAGLVPGLLCFATTIHESLRSGAPASGSIQPFFAPVGLHSIRTALVWLLNPHGWGFDTGFVLLWLGILGTCYLAAWAEMLGSLRRKTPAAHLLRENAWMVIGTLLLLAFFLTPVQVGEWSHARPRFIPLAVLSLLAGLRLSGKKSLRLAVMLGLSLAGLAVEARNTLEFQKRSAEVLEYTSVMDTVQEGAAILPVTNPENGPKYSPNLHAWAYYAMARGSWSPYLHAQTTHNPIIYRVIPWAPGEEAHLRGEQILRRVAACYDYVLLWNPREGDAAALRPFFDIVRATPHLRIWQNRAGVRKSTPASNPACALEAPATANQPGQKTSNP